MESINITANVAFSINNTIHPTSIPSMAPTIVTTLIGVDAGLDDTENEAKVCSFCPSGQTLPIRYGDKKFVNVQDDSYTCGFWENLFSEFTSPAECEESRTVFAGTFDPTVYCHCPESVATGLCMLCPTLASTNGNSKAVVDPERIINGVPCGGYADLAAAATTEAFCRSILDVQGIQEACCGITTASSNDDVEDASMTTAELDGQQQQQQQQPQLEAGDNSDSSATGGEENEEDISNSATAAQKSDASSLMSSATSGMILIPAVFVVHSLC